MTTTIEPKFKLLSLWVKPELLENIDAAAERELLSRSAEVRRKLHAIYGERPRVPA